MRSLLVTSAILIVLGGIAVRYGSTRGELSEWQAGRLPYPGNGFTSSDDFRLHRGGRFELRVVTPSSPQDRNDVWEEVVTSNLRVTIRSTNGFHLERVIGSLRAEPSRTFAPDSVWTLPPGEYEMRVEGHDVPPAVFRERGAAIYLARVEPVGPDIGIELSTYLGYALLLCAAVLTASGAVLRKVGSPGPP